MMENRVHFYWWQFFMQIWPLGEEEGCFVTKKFSCQKCCPGNWCCREQPGSLCCPLKRIWLRRARDGCWRAVWWWLRGAGGARDACVGRREEVCEMKRPRAMSAGWDSQGLMWFERLIGAEMILEAVGVWQHPYAWRVSCNAFPKTQWCFKIPSLKVPSAPCCSKDHFLGIPFPYPPAVVIPHQPQPHLPVPISPHLTSNEGGCVVCLSCAPVLPSGSQQQV